MMTSLMDRLKGKQQVACDSCTHVHRFEELDQLETAVISGFEVIKCKDPVLCRRRAELIGVWCQ